jgi:hypothetical protein
MRETHRETELWQRNCSDLFVDYSRQKESKHIATDRKKKYGGGCQRWTMKKKKKKRKGMDRDLKSRRKAFSGACSSRLEQKERENGSKRVKKVLIADE